MNVITIDWVRWALAAISSWLVLVCLTLFTPPSTAYAQVSSEAPTAKIGVLAFRGAGPAQTQWQPLADYLTDVVEGWQFEIVPLTLVSAPEEIQTNGLDFLITNPGNYVTLSAQFGLSALATRERRTEVTGTGLLRYGTVIFSRKDSGFEILEDLKGKQVGAVSLDAFGGFQLAWQEFTNQGIDLFSDVEALRFMGFPQDEIVFSVLNGDVDAGIVRSGLLESLSAEGRINLTDFVVLQNNSQLGYPHMISGHLYPEWPFTAMPGIGKHLRESVTASLLKTQNGEVSKTYGLTDIWSAPLSYEDVRSLTLAYRNRATVGSFWFELAKNPTVYFGFIIIALVGLIFVWNMRLRAAEKRQTEGIGPVHNAADEDPEADNIRQRFDSLTKREIEILSMICAGSPSKEIAETLCISPKTVEYHRANLLQKTDAGTTAHLVQLATRFGYDLG